MNRATPLRAAPEHAEFWLLSDGRHLVYGSDNQAGEIAEYLVIRHIEWQLLGTLATRMQETPCLVVRGDANGPEAVAGGAVRNNAKALETFRRVELAQELFAQAVWGCRASYEVA